VLECGYSGVTVVLQRCYSGLKVLLVVPLAGHLMRKRCLLQWCYSGVTVV
jgi:hypothetical protein